MPAEEGGNVLPIRPKGGLSAEQLNAQTQSILAGEAARREAVNARSRAAAEGAAGFRAAQAFTGSGGPLPQPHHSPVGPPPTGVEVPRPRSGAPPLAKSAPPGEKTHFSNLPVVDEQEPPNSSPPRLQWGLSAKSYVGLVSSFTETGVSDLPERLGGTSDGVVEIPSATSQAFGLLVSDPSATSLPSSKGLEPPPPALWELSGFRCALKRVIASTAAVFQEFRDEVKILSSLAASPYVIEIYDFQVDEPGMRIWIVMEAAVGGCPRAYGFMDRDQWYRCCMYRANTLQCPVVRRGGTMQHKM